MGVQEVCASLHAFHEANTKIVHLGFPSFGGSLKDF